MNRLIHWPGHPWLALVARLYLGFIFLYACLFKIADPESFALSIATYQFLPLYFVNLLALILPWVELIAGIMIICGFRTQAAALLIVLMMLAFMVALSWALYQGLDMSCGCFAATDDAHPLSFWTLLRDTGWLGLGLYVFWLDRNPLGLDRLLLRRGLS